MQRSPSKLPGPGTDVPGPDEIGMRAMPACTALEFALALAVGFLAMPAVGASPTGVPGVNNDHGDASQLSLVLDKTAELKERPTRKPIALVAAPSGNPVANTLEVFKSDPASGALGGCDDPLGNTVVLVTAKPGFLCFGPLQGPADVLRSLAPPPLGSCCLAKRRSPFPVVSPGGVNLLSGELFVAFRGGDIDHPEIHADKVRGRDRCTVGDVDCDEQEPLTVVSEHEIGLPFGVGKPLGLVLANNERHEHSAGERQEAYTVDALEAHRPLVVDDRGVLTDLDFSGLIPLVGITYAFDRMLCHLAREPEPRANLMVGELADVELVRFLAGEALAGDPVARIIESLDCASERLCLFSIRQQLNLDGELHPNHYSRIRSDIPG
jgi:hypothetical protein